ncbi:hypothetical protein Tco_1347255 [Tanacetum coccineum]
MPMREIAPMGSLLQEFDFKVIDTKGAENLAAIICDVCTAMKLLRFSQLATMDPPGDIMVQTSQPKRSLTPVFLASPSIKMPSFTKVMLNYGVTHVSPPAYSPQITTVAQVDSIKSWLEKKSLKDHRKSRGHGLSPSLGYFPYGMVELSQANGARIQSGYVHRGHATTLEERTTLWIAGLVKTLRFVILQEFQHPQLHLGDDSDMLILSTNLVTKEVDIIKKTENQAIITMTEHGMEKTVQKSSQRQKCQSQSSILKISAVKPEPELKNILNAILTHLMGPGIAHSIFDELAEDPNGPSINYNSPFVCN